MRRVGRSFHILLIRTSIYGSFHELPSVVAVILALTFLFRSGWNNILQKYPRYSWCCNIHLVLSNRWKLHTYIHTYMHACMHACMHAYIHTYIYIYMFIYHTGTFRGIIHSTGTQLRFRVSLPGRGRGNTCVSAETAPVTTSSVDDDGYSVWRYLACPDARGIPGCGGCETWGLGKGGSMDIWMDIWMD